MSRWYTRAILIWLAIVVVLAGVTTVQLYERNDEDAHSVNDEPQATIDGEPAFVMHAYDWAKVIRDDKAVWLRRSLMMLPAEGRSEAPDKPAEYWRATEISEPFHLSFIKPDGTATGPHRIEFREPALFGVRAGWGPRGQRFSLVYGYRNYPQDSSLLDGRVWKRDIVMQIALERLGWAGIAGVGLVVLATGMMVRDVLRLRRDLPPRPTIEQKR